MPQWQDAGMPSLGAARRATLIDVSFPLQSASVFLGSASAVCFVSHLRVGETRGVECRPGN